MEPIKIYYCYTPQDKKLRDELEKHLMTLKRLGQITLRLNREIVDGTNWSHVEDRRFQAADLILLLISPNFISSDYHYGIEMHHALEKHDAGNVWVIPIILRPTPLWEKTPIGKLQALPRGGKAITEQRNRDSAFTDVVKGISEVVAIQLARKQELAFAIKAGEGEFPKFTQVIGPLCDTCGARNPLGVITCGNCGDVIFTIAATSSQEVLNALKAASNQSQSTSRPLGYTQDPLLDQAYRLYTQKRLDEAIALYNKALKANNTNPLGWQGYGLSQQLKGLNQDALSSFEHALQLDSSLVTSWNEKGSVLGKLRRHQEALEAYEHALQLEPQNAAAWNGKGAALHALERSNQALDAFDKALLYDPLLMQAWYNKGLLLHDMGRFRDAEKAFQGAINLDNRFAQAYFGCGQALYAQRKLKQALDMFERAIQEDPKYIEAWNKRGNILNELGDTTQSLQSYDQALQIDAHFAPAWSDRADILRQQGHYSDALKAYNFALDIDPDFALAWNGKATTLYNLRNYHEALAAYEHALKLNPRLGTAWHNKSLVLYQLGRYNESLNAAEEAILLQPNDPDNWQRKADSLKQLRRGEAARSAGAQATGSLLIRETPFSCLSAEGRYCLCSSHLRMHRSIALHCGNSLSQQTTAIAAFLKDDEKKDWLVEPHCFTFGLTFMIAPMRNAAL